MSYAPKFRGNTATGSINSSRNIQTNFQNASGGTLIKATPVSLNSSGQTVAIDVSDQSSVEALVGLVAIDTPNAASGAVIDAGRLEDVTTSFVVGDPVYVSKTGGLTNLRPDIGVGGFVAGDFVIFVGVVAKNEFNGSLKDIKLFINVVGQL